MIWTFVNASQYSYPHNLFGIGTKFWWVIFCRLHVRPCTLIMWHLQRKQPQRRHWLLQVRNDEILKRTMGSMCRALYLKTGIVEVAQRKRLGNYNSSETFIISIFINSFYYSCQQVPRCRKWIRTRLWVLTWEVSKVSIVWVWITCLDCRKELCGVVIHEWSVLVLWLVSWLNK